ncbi:MAG: lysine--tRNA ligase, partial [bacterium]
RVTAIRKMGKASFAEVFSNFKKIQIYIKRDDDQNNYEIFRRTDIGDFINVSGFVFRTKMGEITVHVKRLILICKAFRPLPEKWHGLKDEETILRRRYLDILTNEKSREIFLKRSSVISEIRKFLNGRNYVEVETPLLQSIPGGAEAEPFKTHHKALNIDLFLRIAPELYLKRLIVAGFEKIYEIGRNFRNEGISTRHNPEFTMLELYCAYADYGDMMNLCEEIVKRSAEIISGETVFSEAFARVSIFECLKEKTGIDFQGNLGRDNLRAQAEKLGISFEKDAPPSKIFENIYEEVILKDTEMPVFLMDFPEEFSPLAKPRRGTPIAERFELYINNMEIANAYSELNDPVRQRAHFVSQADDSGREQIDEDFLEALEYGMPPTGGLGIGIDRLIMVLSGSQSIKDVIIFPQLKSR